MVLRASSTATLIAEPELSVVPAGRLGRALTTHREQLNLSLEEMARRSSRQFDADDLRAFEYGLREASDAELHLLRSMYIGDSSRVLPKRMHLVLDLDNRVMQAGELEAKLKRRVVNKVDSEPNKVLQRYLKLVYLLRRQSPGTRVPLREIDMETLGAALELDSDDVAERLTALMERTDWSDRVIQRKILFPAAGILVAATSMGQLVMEPEEAGGPSASGGGSAATTAIAGDADVAGTSTTISVAAVGEETSSTFVVADDADPGAPVIEAQDHGHDHNHSDDPTLAATSDDASAATVDDGTPQHIAKGALAMDMISYDWEEMLPGWTVDFMPQRDGYLGGTFPDERKIEIYVRPSDSPKSLAITLAHELGHAVDVTLNDPSDRAAWRTARGLDDRPWFGEPGASDYATPAGDFAEAFAAWQIDASDFRSEVSGPPSGSHVELLQDLAAA